MSARQHIQIPRHTLLSPLAWSLCQELQCILVLNICCYRSGKSKICPNKNLLKRSGYTVVSHTPVFSWDNSVHECSRTSWGKCVVSGWNRMNMNLNIMSVQCRSFTYSNISPPPPYISRNSSPPSPNPILYFWLLYNMGLIRSHWNDLRTPNIFCGGTPPDPHKWLTTDAFLPTQEFPPHKLHFWKKALWANRTDAKPSILLLIAKHQKNIDLHIRILWKCLFLVYQVSSTWCPAWLNWVLG